MSTASARPVDVFGQAEQTAHEWLATVAGHLSTDDQHRAHRVVRAWLHTVRDRLTVDVAVHFAAQLPLVWRGLFYDGWQPGRVPVKYDAGEFLAVLGQEAGLSPDESRQAAVAVTTALTELTSADHVGHLLAQLPGSLREVLQPGDRQPERPATPVPPGEPGPRLLSSGEAVDLPLDERVDRLEQGVQVLTEALAALVAALDERPSSEPEPARYLAGARRAHQILLSATSPA